VGRRRRVGEVSRSSVSRDDERLRKGLEAEKEGKEKGEADVTQKDWGVSQEFL
jgi:hypothetical protein